MLKQTTPGRRRRLTGLAAATLIVLSGAATAWTLQPADATDPIATTMAGAGPQRNEPSYRAIHPPKYPQAAIDARQSGKVVLKVGIDTAGVPQTIDVEYASLPGVFDAAASDAVKDWLFNPAQRNDQPAAAHVLVPVCFSMDDQQPTCEAGPGALEGIYLKPPAQD